MLTKLLTLLLFCGLAVWSAARTIQRVAGERVSIPRRLLRAVTPLGWVVLGLLALALPPLAGAAVLALALTTAMLGLLWWVIQRADDDDGWRPPEPEPPPVPQAPQEKELVVSRNGDA